MSDEADTYNYTIEKGKTLAKSIKGGSFNQNDFINVASLDPKQFQEYMINAFGDV